MTLLQFLSVLTTDTIQVTIKDVTTGNEIAELKASGYASLDDTIEARIVAQWSIASASHIVVLLNE